MDSWVCSQCRCRKPYPGDGENIFESRIFGRMIRRTICQDCYDIMVKNPHGDGVRMVKCPSCGSIQKNNTQCSICGRNVKKEDK